MTKIVHYRKKCIGCNSCVEHSPNDWEIKEDGKATLKGATKKKKEIYIKKIEEHDKETNKKAAKNCPVRIIKIVE